MKTNLNIIQNSVKFIRSTGPKSVVLASSGLVYENGGQKISSDNKLYAGMKREQEEEIYHACSAVGSSLIIVRIFNISGFGINNSNNYAISEFIEKGINSQDISINSPYMVTRRYCDVSQLLNLTKTIAQHQKSIIFDSGGAVIELRELADRVIKLLDSNSKVLKNTIDINLSNDNYFSVSKDYESLLYQYFNERSSQINDQILNTSRSLYPELIN